MTYIIVAAVGITVMTVLLTGTLLLIDGTIERYFETRKDRP